MIPPISVTVTMLRRCARLSGVSRGSSTRRRRSFSTTWLSQSAAVFSASSMRTPYTAPVAPVMPTIRRFFMAARVHANTMLVVFCPFAAGYYLSFFYRYVNAVIAKDLVQDFGLAPGDLGLLTSAFFLAFAAFQVPLGVLLDRFGPRRCAAVLMCVAAVGALTFGLAQDLAMLSAGRALIGLGVSAGLMGSVKAFTLWFPRERLTALSG